MDTSIMRVLLFLLLTLTVSVFGAARGIPAPLTGNPWNIYLSGQTVEINVTGTGTWQLKDYADTIITSGDIIGGKANVGTPAVGWYRIHTNAEDISLSVLNQLTATTPLTSPIGVHLSAAWLYTEAQRPIAANVCALAGINIVRDSIKWPDLETTRGVFAPTTTVYDDAVTKDLAESLQILHNNANTPLWAGSSESKFPNDLRDAYNFYKQMAIRWSGSILMMEPWNEADNLTFGGYVGCELAAMQKAAYLGAKAGNSSLTVGLMPFAHPYPTLVGDAAANQVMAYADTFNFHAYDNTIDRLSDYYKVARNSTQGKVLWTTETALVQKWATANSPTLAELATQSENIVKVLVATMHEGASYTFLFLLSNWSDIYWDYGVLNADFTPRPAYSSFAAVGMLLAKATAIGKVPSTSAWLSGTTTAARAYVVSAYPGGVQKDVMIAWSTGNAVTMTPPVTPTLVYDHLGRTITPASSHTLTTAPIYMIFPSGTLNPSLLTTALTSPPLQTQPTASNAVLSLIWPDRNKISSIRSAYRIDSIATNTFTVYGYNFSGSEITGTFTVDAPSGWTVGFPASTTIAANGQNSLTLTINCAGKTLRGVVGTVRITGNFGIAGTTILALRVMPTPSLSLP